MGTLFRGLEKKISEKWDDLQKCADVYTEDLFLQSKYPKILLRNAKEDILEGVDTLVTNSAHYPSMFSSEVNDIVDNAYCLLDIITLFAQSSEKCNQRFKPKTFQYIRDYNGKLKITAKQFPPSIQKGVARNREDFQSYDRKLYNSISRSKQKVRELVICNDWKYFVTFTINKEHYDRYDLENYIKAFTKWLSNYSARKTGGVKINYILIPEMGKKGAWHLHGVMDGMPENHLSPFERGKHSQRLVCSKYLNWEAYERKFGYCSFGKIRRKEKVAGYITKYINKSSMTQKRKLHSRLYYTSKGLKHSTELCRGYDLVPIDKYDFENEYVGIKWFENENIS